MDVELEALETRFEFLTAEAKSLNETITANKYEKPEGKSTDQALLLRYLDQAESLKTQIAEAKSHVDHAARVAALVGVGGGSEDRDGKLADLEGKSKDDEEGDDDSPVKGMSAVEFKALMEGFSGSGRKPETKTAGEIFVTTEEYKGAEEKGFTAKHADGGLHAQVETKALLTSPSVPVGNSYEQYSPKPLTLIDAITMGEVGAESFVTHRMILSVNAAAKVVDGGSVAESTIIWQKVTVNVEDVAHWVPVDNNALKDHGLVKGMIDTELAYGVHEKLETFIFADIIATTGVQVEAFDTDMLTTLSNAKTNAELVRAPTGILMNPVDVATIRNLKGTDGHYLNAGGGPFQFTNLVVWGLPVYSSAAVTQGFAILGNLKTITWHEREATTITTGWRNVQFTDRQQSIMANARGLTNIQLPGALVYVDLAL